MGTPRGAWKFVLVSCLTAWWAVCEGANPHLKNTNQKQAITAAAVRADSRLPNRGQRALRGVGRTNLVVVCNAFPDVRPAFVGVMTSKETDKDALDAVSRLKSLLSDGNNAPQEGNDGMRSINYGSCEEYHMDVDHRRLFFLPPGNGSRECEFDAKGESVSDELALSQQKTNVSTAGPVINGEFERVAVVLKQPLDASTKCVATAVSLPEADPPTAELVVLDAYARKTKDEDGMEEEEREMETQDAALGLSPLPPLDTGSVIRLEDQVESYAIASEVVASRTLTPGQIYNVEPKRVHVSLEDLRGSNVFDTRDIKFEPAHTYVGMRIGRADDKAFPQKLIFYSLRDTTRR